MDVLHKTALKIPIFFRYLVSGGIAASVNLITLFILADIFGVWYLSASVAAFSFALVVSFTLQKFLTFADRRMEIAKEQFFTYTIVTFINLFINVLLMYLFTDGLGFYHILSQVLASGIIAIISFFVYRHLIFHDRYEIKVSGSQIL